MRAHEKTPFMSAEVESFFETKFGPCDHAFLTSFVFFFMAARPRDFSERTQTEKRRALDEFKHDREKSEFVQAMANNFEFRDKFGFVNSTVEGTMKEFANEFEFAIPEGFFAKGFTRGFTNADFKFENPDRGKEDAIANQDRFTAEKTS